MSKKRIANLISYPNSKRVHLDEKVPLEMKEMKDIQPSFSSSSSSFSFLPVFRLHVLEIIYRSGFVWLFGLNEDYKKGDPHQKRTVSVKIPCLNHIVYDGSVSNQEILRWPGVKHIKTEKFGNLCLYNAGKRKNMRKIYYQYSKDKKNILDRLQNRGKTYNGEFNPVLEFIQKTKCELFRVALISKYTKIHEGNKKTINDLEIKVLDKHIQKANSPDDIPNSVMRECDWDIETLNLVADPSYLDETEQPDVNANQVVTICLSIHDQGDCVNTRRIALVLDPADHNAPADYCSTSKQKIIDYLNEKDSWGVEEFKGEDAKKKGTVYTFRSEVALLKAARTILTQCDVLTGWNSITFDLYYLFSRARLHRRTDLMCYSKFKGEVCQESKTGKGDYFIQTPGIIQHDAKRSCELQTNAKKLPSYKLTHVSQKYLSLRKRELPWEKIKPAFVEEGTIGRAKIADYCIWDVDLVTLLCITRDYFTSTSGLANMNAVNFTDIQMRGQQKRVANILELECLDSKLVMNGDDLKKAMRNYKPVKTQVINEDDYDMTQTTLNFLNLLSTDETQPSLQKPVKQPVRRAGRRRAVNQNKKKKKNKKKYDGGFVLKPKPGRYKNVTVIDYKALYPSIIIAYGLCYRSILFDKAYVQRLKAQGRDIFEINNPGAYCAFVTDAEETLCPRVLRRLLGERTATKKKMAAAKLAGDDKLASLLDARQLAIKLGCNSWYGFMGTDPEKGARFPCLAIAVTITGIGRNLLCTLKEYVERVHPHLSVVYGDTDSIFVKWPDGWPPEKIIVHAERLAEELNKHPIHRNYLILEFESLFINCLLCGKKCYAGGKYEGPNKPLSEYFKGLSVVRRDRCDWERNVMKSFLCNLVVEPVPVEEILKTLRKDMLSIKEAKLHDFTITCKVNKSYVNQNLVQCKVMNEVRTRLGSYNAVTPGDRIRFLYRSGVNSKKAADWGVQYDHALDQEYKPHHEHYLKKLYKSLTPIVSLLGTNCTRQFTKDFNAAQGKIVRSRNNQRSIFSFMQSSRC